MMKKYLSLCLAVIMLMSFNACEEDSDDSDIILPLNGTYALTNLTISEEARSINDTTLTLLDTLNGALSYYLSANTLVKSSSTSYTDQDASPISGTVTLNNDGSASLSGSLPVNWGTGCNPFLQISSLSSDGDWAADTSLATFSLDLVVDALDINGTFSLTGNQIEIRYTTLNEADQRIINTVPNDGAGLAVELTCLAVSTTTERVMLLTIQD